MTDVVVFKSMLAERGWKVTRDDRLVSHYPSQKIAENAVTRLARNEANKGHKAHAIMHKRDGSVAREHSYSKINAPWLGR